MKRDAVIKEGTDNIGRFIAKILEGFIAGTAYTVTQDVIRAYSNQPRSF